MFDLLTPFMDTAVDSIVRTIDCPPWICNATPDFTAFGDRFVDLMSKGWAAAWALMIVAAAFYVLFASLQLRAVNKKTDPTAKAHAHASLMGSIAGLAGAVLVPAIIFTVLAFVG